MAIGYSRSQVRDRDYEPGGTKSIYVFKPNAWISW